MQIYSMSKWPEVAESANSFKLISNQIFLKNGPFPASFSLFSSFQYTVDSKQMFNIN